jgi:hypothetical protein
VKIEEEYDHVRVSYGRTHRERQRQAHREAKKMRRCEVKEKQLHRKSLLKVRSTAMNERYTSTDRDDLYAAAVASAY